jgi:hypothetical protein
LEMQEVATVGFKDLLCSPYEAADKVKCESGPEGLHTLPNMPPLDENKGSLLVSVSRCAMVELRIPC